MATFSSSAYLVVVNHLVLQLSYLLVIPLHVLLDFQLSMILCELCYVYHREYSMVGGLA